MPGLGWRRDPAGPDDQPGLSAERLHRHHRIRYGTGRVVAKGELAAYAQGLLDDPDIAFVDVRSARNNCFQCRIVRG